jgi:hypothetical protein
MAVNIERRAQWRAAGRSRAVRSTLLSITDEGHRQQSEMLLGQ